MREGRFPVMLPRSVPKLLLKSRNVRLPTSIIWPLLPSSLHICLVLEIQICDSAGLHYCQLICLPLAFRLTATSHSTCWCPAMKLCLATKRLLLLYNTIFCLRLCSLLCSPARERKWCPLPSWFHPSQPPPKPDKCYCGSAAGELR